MKIALDYDGTFTLDPDFWSSFIKLAVESGHEVVIVTKRYLEEEIRDAPCNVIYTSRQAKLFSGAIKAFNPDIWIDNNPLDIVGYPI